MIDQKYQKKNSPPEPVDDIDARLARLPERKENDRDLNMRRRGRGRGWEGRRGLFIKTFRTKDKILGKLHNLGVKFPKLQIFWVKALNQNFKLTHKP